MAFLTVTVKRGIHLELVLLQKNAKLSSRELREKQIFGKKAYQLSTEKTEMHLVICCGMIK